MLELTASLVDLCVAVLSASLRPSDNLIDNSFLVGLERVSDWEAPWPKSEESRRVFDKASVHVLSG